MIAIVKTRRITDAPAQPLRYVSLRRAGTSGPGQRSGEVVPLSGPSLEGSGAVIFPGGFSTKRNRGAYAPSVQAQSTDTIQAVSVIGRATPKQFHASTALPRQRLASRCEIRSTSGSKQTDESETVPGDSHPGKTAARTIQVTEQGPSRRCCCNEQS